MFKKIFNLTILMMFLIIGCSDDEPITGGVNPEPE